jgi:hypothetical protein
MLASDANVFAIPRRIEATGHTFHITTIERFARELKTRPHDEKTSESFPFEDWEKGPGQNDCDESNLAVVASGKIFIVLKRTRGAAQSTVAVAVGRFFQGHLSIAIKACGYLKTEVGTNGRRPPFGGQGEEAVGGGV